MISDITKGLASYFKSFSLLRKNGLLKYLLFSGVISLICGTLIFTTIWKLSDPIGDFLSGFYPFEIGDGLIASIAEWGSFLVLLYLAVMSYKYVVLIVTAPIMSILSEKIELNESNLGDSKLKSNMLKSLMRGMRISLRNLSMELLLSGLVLFVAVSYTHLTLPTKRIV